MKPFKICFVKNIKNSKGNMTPQKFKVRTNHEDIRKVIGDLNNTLNFDLTNVEEITIKRINRRL